MRSFIETLRSVPAAALLIGVPLLAFSFSAKAQIATEPVLGLSQAVEMAIATNPAAKAGETRVKIAEAKIRETTAGKWPFAQFSQSAVRSNNPVYVFGSLLEQGRFGPSNFSIDSLNKPAGLFNFRTQFNAQMPIFDQRQTSSRVSQAEIAKKQAELMADAALQRLRFDVVRSFYGVILGRELIRVSDDAIGAAEANRKKVSDMVDVGMTTEADLLAADLEVATGIQRKIEAQSQLVNTIASLNITTGTNADRERALAGELKEKFFPAADQTEVIRLALESRPDYRCALLDVENSRVKTKALRDMHLPRVDAFGNVGYSSPYIANGSSDYTVGVNLTYTLFDAGRKAREQQAVEGVTLAALERDNLANQVRLDVIRAYQAFKTADARIRVSIKSIARAEEALRITDDRYKAGLTTFSEVVRAGAALTGARQDMLNSRYEFYIGYAGLLLATGTLTDVRWFD
ncbi:MAG: TolC family protein [Acidobacteriota bacterium]